MPVNDILAFVTLGLAVLLVTPALGSYIARIMEGERTLLSPVLVPVERGIYRVMGVDPAQEQGWKPYTVGLLVFSVVSIVCHVGENGLKKF